MFDQNWKAKEMVSVAMRDIDIFQLASGCYSLDPCYQIICLFGRDWRVDEGGLGRGVYQCTSNRLPYHPRYGRITDRNWRSNVHCGANGGHDE